MKVTLFLSAAAIASTVFAQNATTSDTEPQCIALCVQCKLVEAPQLAPSCDSSDLSCLCNTSPFTKAYNHCLRDNCASSLEVEIGLATFAQVCANAGVAMSTFVAQTGEAAKETAIAQVASLLGKSVSGSVPIPTPSFDQGSAMAAASSYQLTQAAIATSSAVAALSQAEAQASLEINREIGILSASLAARVREASATQQALATQLDASQYAIATSQIAATLSMMKVAVSSKIAADQASAAASLAMESAQLFPATTSAVVNAKQTSFSSRKQVQAGLALVSLVGAILLL